MKMKQLALALAFALLLGCVSNSPSPNSSSTPVPNAPDAPPNATNSSSVQQPYVPPANPSPLPPAPSPYAGKDFAALSSLNVPLACDITYIYQGRTYQAKAYMKGGSDIRVETVGGSGLSQCVKTISIVQGQRLYVGCENKTVIPSCDWFTSGYDPSVPGQASTFDFSKTPPDQISCADWAYDPSYFSTQGRTCSLGG